MDKQEILSIIDNQIEAAKSALRADQDAGDSPDSYDVGNGYGKLEALKTFRSVISGLKEPSDTATLLLEMDNIVRHINDENAYSEWSAVGVPDGASVEEVEEIAKDKDSANDIAKAFATLIVAYGHGKCAFVGRLDGYTKKGKEDR